MPGVGTHSVLRDTFVVVFLSLYTLVCMHVLYTCLWQCLCVYQLCARSECGALEKDC